MTSPTGGTSASLTRSSRTSAALADRLQAWLATRLPAGAQPAVRDVETSAGNGMSSETVLFSAAWQADGAPHDTRLVARVAPHADDVPVFPDYDLQRQFDTIALVARRTPVPVPALRWCEPDPAPLGSPFFVMDRVDGTVPPDLMPYNFGDSWLYAATPVQQRRLQDATVAVLAALHEVEASDPEAAFLHLPREGETPLRRHVAHTRRWYDFVAADGLRSPLVERGFRWLDAHWPVESPAVLCWGDSRIGNVLYADFEPVAVLDWEMAALGPRELDVAWLIYAHRCFEDMATAFGFPGMPGFLRRDDVVEAYESASGARLRDLDFYLCYAALQWAITFLRTGQRSVRFGERELPEDVDDLILNRPTLEQLIAE